MAQIDLARQDYQSAFPRLVESFQILGHLQRPDGIALVGIPLGQLLMAAGRPDQARDVLSDPAAPSGRPAWPTQPVALGAMIALGKMLTEADSDSATVEALGRYHL